jgi:hypothetical protein
LQKGDAIVAMDGTAVGDDGTVHMRGDELLALDFLITGRPASALTSPPMVTPLTHGLPLPHPAGLLSVNERLDGHELSVKVTPLTHGLAWYGRKLDEELTFSIIRQGSPMEVCRPLQPYPKPDHLCRGPHPGGLSLRPIATGTPPGTLCP